MADRTERMLDSDLPRFYLVLTHRVFFSITKAYTEPRTCRCVVFNREFCFRFYDTGRSPHFKWITSKIVCHDYFH